MVKITEKLQEIVHHHDMTVSETKLKGIDEILGEEMPKILASYSDPTNKLLKSKVRAHMK